MAVLSLYVLSKNLSPTSCPENTSLSTCMFRYLLQFDLIATGKCEWMNDWVLLEYQWNTHSCMVLLANVYSHCKNVL